MTQPEKSEGDSQRTKIIVLAVLLVAGLAGVAVGRSVVQDGPGPLIIAVVLICSMAWIVVCVSLSLSLAPAIGIAVTRRSNRKKGLPGPPKCWAERHELWCGQPPGDFVVDSKGKIGGDGRPVYCQPTRPVDYG